MVTISNVIKAGGEPIQDVTGHRETRGYCTLSPIRMAGTEFRFLTAGAGRLVLLKAGWDIRSETEYRDVTDGHHRWEIRPGGGGVAAVPVGSAREGVSRFRPAMSW